MTALQTILFGVTGVRDDLKIRINEVAEGKSWKPFHRLQANLLRQKCWWI